MFRNLIFIFIFVHDLNKQIIYYFVMYWFLNTIISFFQVKLFIFFLEIFFILILFISTQILVDFIDCFDIVPFY